MRFGLEPDLSVVGEADDGMAALAMAEMLQPNIILMDAEMPAMDGITATSQLCSARSKSAVVILTAHDTADLRAKATAAGAAAFITKNAYIEQLIAAIRGVASTLSTASNAVPIVPTAALA